jgi:hypothetical protein
MATACIAHSALRAHGISKPCIARFDQPHASSDGGAILVKPVDDRLGLTVRLASAVRDVTRNPAKSLIDSAIWCGSACSAWRVATPTTTTQQRWPTTRCTSCCSNGIRRTGLPWLAADLGAVRERRGWPDLYRLGSALADTMLVYHHERLGPDVRLITIDLDATDDPTHGQQELALFNGYDGRIGRPPSTRGCIAAGAT